MNYSKLESLIRDFNKASKRMIDVKKYTYYAITYHSTSIEGSTLTENQVINLLEYGQTATGKPFEHHQMVSDHYKAMLFVSECAKEKRPLSPQLIKSINALVMKGTGSEINAIMGTFDSSKGDYRLCGVHAGTHVFPDYKKVPSTVKKICEDINSGIDTANNLQKQCELAFKLHFDLVSIHPFADGNGRTSRLMMNYLLEYFNLPPLYIGKDNKISYINALENTRKKEDITIFYSYMYKQYIKFLQSEIKNLNR